jgi:lipopolysaccharide export system permease protein
MPVLTRHVLAELLRVFSVTLAIVTAIFLFAGIVIDLMPRDLGALQIARLMPFLLPEALRNSTQAAALFAVCSVFGKMASSNELVAIKSLGISPMVVIKPAICLAVAQSLFCVWLYDVGEGWGKDGVDRVVLESAEEIAYGMLAAQRSYSTPHLAINVKRVEGRRLIRPTLLYQPPNDAHAITITAEEGLLRTNLRERTLTISFYNGTAYAGEELTMAFPDTFEQVVPLGEATRTPADAADSHPTMGEIRATIAQLRLQLPQLKKAAAAAGRDQPGAPEAAAARAKYETAARKLTMLEALFHRRWANGFFCLAYCMVGIPIAAGSRSGEALKAFFLSFVPIVFVNQPLHNFSIKLAEAGEAPAWWPWFGNFVLMAAGAWMMRHTVRH